VGRYAEAVSEMQEVPLRADLASRSFSGDAQGYLKMVLDPHSTWASTQIAEVYALMGDRDKAFKYLEEACAT
jgi:hypothetical protein